MGNEYYYYGSPFGNNGYSMDDSVTFGASNILSGVTLGLYSILLLYMLIAWIFRSLGLYHMAKDRGIAHAWFAWIPILSFYVLGRLINNKVVLGDNIVLPHAEFFLPFLEFLGFCGLGLGQYGTIITGAIWVYVISAYWRLFKIYRPKSRVSFTIWSAILGSGFFVFAIREDRPFDPLEPNKIYQNFYGKKNRIVENYDRVEQSLRAQEQYQSDELRSGYEAQMSQKNLTEDQKQELTKEYNENKKRLQDNFDSIIKEEKNLETKDIKNLEASIDSENDPRATMKPDSKQEEINIEPEEEIILVEFSPSEIEQSSLSDVEPEKDLKEEIPEETIQLNSTETVESSQADPFEGDEQEAEDFEETEEIDDNLSRLSEIIYDTMKNEKKSD